MEKLMNTLSLFKYLKPETILAETSDYHICVADINLVGEKFLNSRNCTYPNFPNCILKNNLRKWTCIVNDLTWSWMYIKNVNIIE